MLNKIKTIMAVTVLSGTVSANVQAATVTVQKGDTLWDLSRANDTSVENIQKLNHLTTDLIVPGEDLAIASEQHYTVKQGETLWDIAMNHHVTVSQIKEWNQLITDLIYPGLNLLIFDGVNTTNHTVTEKIIEPAAQQTVTASHPAAPAPKPAAPAQKEITVKATAYTASCDGCSGTTATGIDIKAKPDEKVIAVDPNVIPLGSKVYVEGFGEATAADTGGAIKGKRIDVFIPSEHKALKFGVRRLKVTILN